LEQYYRKAPQYKQCLSIIKEVLNGDHQIISVLAVHSIKAICDYLGIKTEIIETATNYANSHLKAEDRVIDICLQEKARVYVNAAGGRELYSRDNFEKMELILNF